MNYEDLYLDADLENGLPIGLTQSIAGAETGHIKDDRVRNRVRSPAGAVGRMQFMPATGQRFGLRSDADLTDPAKAIPAAGQYLGQLYKEFGKPELAAAAYNAGEGAVRKYGGVPPYKETQKYVPRVMRNLASVSHGHSMLQKYSPSFAQRTADFFIPPAYGADQPQGLGVMGQARIDLSGLDAIANEPDAHPAIDLSGLDAIANEPEEQTGMGQFAEGVKQSLWDTGTAIGQGARAILPQSTADAMELPTRADVDAAAAKRSALMGTVPGAIGGIVGDIGQTLVGGAALKGMGALANMPKVAAAGNALMAPKTVGQAATVGGLLGAAQPVGTDDSALANTGIGALSGAAGYGALKGLGAAIAPRLSPEVQMMVDEGVTPTIGAMGGKALRATEDKLTSIPGAGDIVRSQKDKALASFNRATVGKVLKPLGAVLPDDVPAGYPAIQYAAEAISNQYNSILPSLTVPIDKPFKKGVNSVVQRAASLLPDDKAQQLVKLVQSELIDRARGGALSGQAMNVAHSNLMKKSADFGASADADQREIGRALKNITTLLLSKAERANPGARPALKAAREAHSLQVRLERAAGSTGAKDGIFTGAQLANATKALDKSARKRATAQGRAPLQRWAEAGDKVLGQKVPDSGTPGRGLLSLGTLGLGYVEPSTIAANAGLAGMYTDLMQNAMRGYVINPSAARQWSRQALEKAAPGLAGMAAAYGSTR